MLLGAKIHIANFTVSWQPDCKGKKVGRGGERGEVKGEEEIHGQWICSIK